jgi:catalase
MSVTKASPLSDIVERTIHAFDDLNGLQAGFRPAHAKGILLTGKFTPSPEAMSLSRAPHLQSSSTPVTVRFSDFAGIPTVPDNDPNASPRGVAIRFHLAEHVHTDIIGHSADGFPVRTADEFVEFLHAIFESTPTAPKPTPIEKFLAAHPTAAEFVQMPKPFPVSFAKESYFGPNAYKFVNKDGVGRYGRFRIRPDGANEYLDDAAAGKKTPNFLFDDIKARIAKGPVKMRVSVQLAEAGDPVNDATAHWPKERREIDLGVFEINALHPNDEAEQRHIIFDPIPRVDGIEPSEDPLLQVRADVYLATGRRRRSAVPK